ncbi:shikimate dehydrogenase [Candidatus Saganbacteria bacterium CG08_land_8_20_14_0_20_45_16]|uniref:Shikimate dehydrogenase (NADP(+)) n=1 Tax=Candidatus Saganbacteria bacterium CG08_land_8_20_14_0_20_45_16 TaxID=2014293 RepID=A0A2H0XYY7_UNCSA|nr:MAG: shikimate dehydrogenase [Candidatus Saganbacteria bacterium CG08_land_8_20_14_0_20_45_16]
MTKIVGLIGHPLGHSLSPLMHNAAFKELGLDFEYKLFDVSLNELAQKVKELRGKKFAGFNITIPYKEKVMELIDEVVENAKVIGAVNTIVNDNGKLIGYNTDGPGFVESLRDDAGVNPQGLNAVVLGAGGASRAILVTLAEEKANSIIVTDIDQEKASQLAQYVGSYFNVQVKSVKPDSRELQAALDNANLLINATPIGMHPHENTSPLSDKIQLAPELIVYDLVYNPYSTKLMKRSKNSVSGLGMLVRQGALAFTLWTGREAPVKLMHETAFAAL